VWSDWKSDHEWSTEVLIVRDKERAAKRWLISDEIRYWSMEWRRRKEKKCGKMTWSAAIAGEHDKNRNGSIFWNSLRELESHKTSFSISILAFHLLFGPRAASLLLNWLIETVRTWFLSTQYANLCEAASACCLLQRCCCDPLRKCWIPLKLYVTPMITRRWILEIPFFA